MGKLERTYVGAGLPSATHLSVTLALSSSDLKQISGLSVHSVKVGGNGFPPAEKYEVQNEKCIYLNFPLTLQRVRHQLYMEVL